MALQRPRTRLAIVFMAISLLRVESRSVLPLLESKNVIQGGEELLEMTKNMPDPEVKDLNNTVLLKKLGRNFDSFFMSVTPPVVSRRPNGMSLTVRTAPLQKQAGTMPWNIQQLQFEINRGENGRRRQLGNRASNKLRLWLWELSKCPVKYIWTDLGPKIFPRYIKSGQCAEKPCSFPAGMTCQPRSTKPLRVLFWICPSNAINGCLWHPYTYGVLASCKCGCSS